MIRIAICDDNKHIGSQIENIIYEYTKYYNLDIEIEVFFTGEDLLGFIQDKFEFDLIFLDIELGERTGIDIGNIIRNKYDNHTTKIVFITAKDGYEMKLFDLQPFNFIKKPIDENKVIKCLELAAKLLEKNNQYFEYNIGHNKYKVEYKDILYFERSGRKISIVTKKGEHMIYDSLSSIKENVPSYFISASNSHLVNYDNIETVSKTEIIMINKDKIFISQRNTSSVRKIIIEIERRK